MAGCSTYDITIERGSTWSLPLLWLQSDGTTPMNLTGFEAQMMIKDLDGNVVAHLKSEGAPFAAGSIEGVITLGGVAGTLEPLLTEAQTLTILASLEQGTYDLKVKDTLNKVSKLLGGSVSFTTSVTEWL